LSSKELALKKDGIEIDDVPGHEISLTDKQANQTVKNVVKTKVKPMQRNPSAKQVRPAEIEIEDQNSPHQLPVSIIKKPVCLLNSRLDLLEALFKYSKPDSPEKELG